MVLHGIACCTILHFLALSCTILHYLVTPKRASLNPEKVQDLVVVKCNLRLLKGMGFIQ